MKKYFFIAGLLTILNCHAQQSISVIPSKAQLRWADAEVGVLIHFDMPVFEPGYNFRKDWNYHPDLSIFNPKELDTDQWLKAAKSAGATYAVLVAKHCSGFSLWPTKAHPYSVKNTPWQEGKGDIVKDFIASCRKYGIKPGIYASTTANGYLKVDNPGKVVSGDPEEQKKYNDIVKMQLTELWSQYGKLFEVWFDGGVMAPEKGGFDVLSLLKKHQPDAIAFQGPFGYENNIRWVGNENGVAPYPCWARADSTTSATGVIQIKGLNGNPEGKFWCPGEADFPLRKNASFQGGWFWHKDQDDQLRSLNELMDRYYKSVGRNTNMLLGIVVDDRGLVPEPDMQRLKEFGDEINKRFSNPIALTSGAGEKINLKLANKQNINLVVLMEDIAKGERIKKFVLEGKTDKGWEKIFEGSCIGHKFIHQFDAIEVSSVRLNVLESIGEPQLLDMSVYSVED